MGQRVDLVGADMTHRRQKAEPTIIIADTIEKGFQRGAVFGRGGAHQQNDAIAGDIFGDWGTFGTRGGYGHGGHPLGSGGL